MHGPQPDEDDLDDDAPLRPSYGPLLIFLALVALVIGGGLYLSGDLGGEGARVDFVFEPKGGFRYDDLHGWSSSVQKGAGRHRVSVGIDIDPAQMMMWARTDQQYRVILDVMAEGPDGVRYDASLFFPINEMKKIGEEDGTELMMFKPAGAPLEDGFRRIASQRALGFTPEAGPWTLKLRTRTPAGADRKAIRAIRRVRFEVSVLRPELGMGGFTSQGWLQKRKKRR